MTKADHTPTIIAPAQGVALDMTLGRRVPALAAADGVVVDHGSLAELRARHPNAQALTRGGLAIPGFRDPHLHLLRAASAQLSADCSAPASPDIDALLAQLRAQRQRVAPGDWVRGSGYDHRLLRERRHPLRRELDQAVPDRPLILRHRSGHACVLNARALRMLGIDAGTPDPPNGWFERDDDGSPTGLLVDGEQLLRMRGLPRLGEAELAAAVSMTSAQLARAGVTWICDTSINNDERTYELFDRLRRAGRIQQRWSQLQGIDAFLAQGGRRDARFAGVKLMVSSGSGAPSIGVSELARRLCMIDRAGAVAAVHAIEIEELVVTLSAYERCFADRGRGALPHRIEHASSCPAELAGWIAALRLTVVTQPAFTLAFGDAYLEASTTPADWLYPSRTLLDAGVLTAASSDAPAGPSAPLEAIAAGVERRTQSGRVIGERQRLDVVEAFGLYDGSAVGDPATLTPGRPADLAVLDADPLLIPAAEIGALKVLATVTAGRIAHAQ